MDIAFIILGSRLETCCLLFWRSNDGLRRKNGFFAVLELVSWKSFQNCVDRHRGDYYVKSFYCREFFRVMIAILKKRLNLPQTLNEILHILSVTPFEKMPISSVFFAKNTLFQTCANPNQLMLFDL